MKNEPVTQEVPEGKARGRILAYMAPPPEFVGAAPLHMRSALIVGEMGLVPPAWHQGFPCLHVVGVEAPLHRWGSSI